ncbi:MAG: Mu-like prophage major head subunit gpT family protein [Calditrichia bacterium]
MLTRKDIPNLLTAGLRREFMKGGEGYPSFFPEFTMSINSTTDQETYGWLGNTPAAREWIDERHAKGLAESSYTLVNADYEATIAVDRNALDDDRYGQVKIRVNQLGLEAKRYYDVLATATIETGNATNCYDGQFFFDTDHVEDENVTSQSNSPAAAAGFVFAAAGIKTVVSAMKKFTDGKNKLAGIMPTHVMVPTDLEFTARQLLDPAAVSVTTSPAEAVLKGYLKIIVNPYLTNGGVNSVWYMMDLSKSTKPFIFQNRKAPMFTALDNPDSTELFMRKKIYYGIDFRCAFGYGDWRQAFRAEGA